MASTLGHWTLVLLALILFGTWLFALGSLLTALVESRFPDQVIAQRSRRAWLVISVLIGLLLLFIGYAGIRVFEVLVLAQINQILK
jgi:hypothetical protein